jgi:glycosyltransferase involved in cell wall biosynthesis
MSATTSQKFQPMPLPALPRQPLFSVLVRNYNYAQYIGTALQSVLDQTYGNFEVIVCDDGSTDNSRDVVQEYVRKDPRVRLIGQDNRGVASAANTAYENSRGELIALLDADDVFKPSKLERALAEFQNNPRSGLCVNPVLPVSPLGQPLGPPFPAGFQGGWTGPEKLRAGGCTVFPPSSGLTLRREVATELFPIPVVLTAMEDFFLAGTAQFFTEISVAPEALTVYRVHKTTHSEPSGAGLRPAFSTFKTEIHVGCVRSWERVLPAQKEFLRRFYGPEIAETLRLEDNPGYWDVLLAIRALRGPRAGAIRPYSVQEMIDHVPRTAEKRLWRALMLLPHPIASWAYRFWRTPSRLKDLVRAAVLPLVQR